MSDHMAKRQRKIGGAKVFILPVILFIATVLIWNAWNGVSIRSTDDSIKFIREHINGKNVIVDYQREICADSIDDFKLFVKDGKVTIDYGNIKLTWTLEEFCSDEVGEQLETIFITRYKDAKTGKLRVFWRGEEIERWVS